MVGATGFEPATSWSQTKCSTGLSYAPINGTLTMTHLAPVASATATESLRQFAAGSKSVEGKREPCLLSQAFRSDITGVWGALMAGCPLLC